MGLTSTITLKGGLSFTHPNPRPSLVNRLSVEYTSNLPTIHNSVKVKFFLLTSGIEKGEGPPLGVRFSNIYHHSSTFFSFLLEPRRGRVLV